MLRKKKDGGKQDQYIDSWTIGLPHSGRPVINEIQRFLDGHDRNKSFSAQLFRTRALVRNWIDSSSNTEGLNEIKREFKQLLQRWYHYEKFFWYLPFADTMHGISENLYSVKGELDKKETTNLNPTFETLSKIYDSTKDVIQPIVFPIRLLVIHGRQTVEHINY